MNASHSVPSSTTTPLALAAGHGNVEMVRCLLSAKASTADGHALHIATDRGHLSVVRRLKIYCVYVCNKHTVYI